MSLSDYSPFIVGQRVILSHAGYKEIGIVVPPQNQVSKGVWVKSPTAGYASCYDPSNIKPLPNNQL